MKKNLLILLSGVAVLFSACQKDEITVTLKQAGSLSVQLTDNAGTKYSGITVKVYDSYTSNSSELDKKVTDSEGKVDFGELNAGSYYVVADTLKLGNKKYVVGKAVQVVGGSSKSYVFNADDFTGKIKINASLSSSYSYDTLKLKNIKVSLLEYYYPTGSLNRQQALSKAVYTTTLDKNGNAVFENIPSNITYMAYFYVNNDDTLGYLSYNNVNVSTGGSSSYSFNLYSSNLYYMLASYTATFTYYSYTTYNETPIKNANVIIVKYNDYSNNDLYYASITEVKKYKVAEYVTDNNGKISGKLPLSNDFKALVYYNNTSKDWSSSFSLYNSTSTNNVSFSLSGSNLGLSK